MKKIDNDKRIDAAIRLIKLWKKNIRFMKKRIEIQNSPDYCYWTQIKPSGYVRRDYVTEKQYYQFDIEMEELKIEKAKAILRTL